jgi:CheY-like chemotaxis protein
LGLAIVRHLTELHGGSVSASSSGEGQGATFTIRLPLAIIHEVRDKLSTSELRLHTAPGKSSSEFSLSLDGVKVLAVDDEPDARELLSVVLSQSRAEIRTASSAMEALRILDEWLPDVIISDIGMPSQDGYTLIRSIRTRPAERGGRIPAAALTAYARSEDRVKALAAGYQTHVSKPVDPAELVAIVASLAGRTGRA